MMGNLLDNAIRHAQCNGQVTAALERTNQHVVFRSPMMDPALRQPIKSDFQAVCARGDIRWRVSVCLLRIGSRRLRAGWLSGSQPGCPTFVVTLPADSAGLKCAHDAVIWHLRPPLKAACAARELPSDSCCGRGRARGENPPVADCSFDPSNLPRQISEPAAAPVGKHAVTDLQRLVLLA